MNKYQYDGLLAEKVAAEHPLTFKEDSNCCDAPIVQVDLCGACKEHTAPYKEEDDEYWQNQKVLMVKTMDESKRQTGRF